MFTKHLDLNRARWLLVITAALAAILLLAGVWAQQGSVQAAGGYDPPPRPTRTPTQTPPPTPTSTPAVPPTPGTWPTPVPQPVRDSPAAQGATIELHVRLAAGQQDPWTVVEWRDTSGRWHAVDGWQGALDEVRNGQGTKAWWLSDSLLGRGPFRWAVLEGPGGTRLATSAPFSLPDQVGQTLLVEVTIEP